MITKAVSKTIEFYIRYLSRFKPACCRFYPTCSEYALEAIQKKGLISGLGHGFCRILRCNPFFQGGHDPVR
ncbi:MAG: membrane protein insertion efficiency factor YidD [Candidatus Omnitrophica bacterium]|nr:membrane protein insertion efficiency factor YidD [Candidatus Omnitrophota bacterium]MCK4422560.1 membrane protein insertion efficiency factor YidD [Candidatus Omnitrophota bacterium]